MPFHSQNFKSGYQAVFSFSFHRSLQSSVCSISSSKHTCHYIDIKTSCKSVKPYIYENRNIHSSFLLLNIINSLLLVTKSWTVAGAELLGLKKVLLSFRWLEADIGIVNLKALTFQFINKEPRQCEKNTCMCNSPDPQLQLLKCSACSRFSRQGWRLTPGEKIKSVPSFRKGTWTPRSVS